MVDIVMGMPRLDDLAHYVRDLSSAEPTARQSGWYGLENNSWLVAVYAARTHRPRRCLSLGKVAASPRAQACMGAPEVFFGANRGRRQGEEMTTQKRKRLVRKHALTFACPMCGAKAGNRCVSLGGQLRHDPHRQRRIAVKTRTI